MTGTLTARTPYGDARGRDEGGVFVWRGIPYAAPPVGELRFRAPRPPAVWSGTRDCTEFGPIAPQSLDNAIPMDPASVRDEDCLTVNVWAAPPSAEPRPVMVWIHGGAYYLGGSSQAIYDAHRLAASGEVVVVTVNFRVGVFGFLDLSSLSDAEHVFETNLGLRDQIAALEWVRDCIGGFGGDPGCVTVFGESSGAGSITTLMTVPRAQGLFHRAIAQSPPATSVYGGDRAATVARRFLDLVDLAPEHAGKLVEMPVDQLIAAGDTLVDEIPTKVPGTLAMAPVVDRDLVPHYPVAAFQKGLAHRIPLIIGTNRDEASIFRLMRSPLMPVTSDSVSAMFAGIVADNEGLPPERIAAIIAAYPDLPRAKGVMALSRDAAFRMPSQWIADAHSRFAPTWMYRFDQATPMLKAARIGAGHAAELPYVFGNFGTMSPDPTFLLGGRRTALEVSGRMRRRWVSFGAHGVPAALDGSKHWTRYDEDTRTTLVIDKVDTLVDDPDSALRQAWGDDVMGFS
ncbi:carboxylesterase/lipase family protein [Rhodococcus sp. D2-41]|uniref:Carboxylic ester hydrolase n=1 Tax=Speluncibacter jeojiensis TaxID=2710754 RepID=A0A9X4REG9_9ACTN|nr:carboxylesterase/lipase family protein [Rhodococcus sp. D2-41]MDG3012663.1 carboxylesterase/lipase family protein [Rhodococcus sp. D2-41]MDG3015232.1 carboxylesterase/lipase family protein [Corynebacteriales bacterium D3-21]